MSDSYFAKLSAIKIQKMKIWESAREWFEEQGYFLYETVEGERTKYEYAKPTREYPDTPPVPSWYRNYAANVFEDPFPYSFMGPATESAAGSRPLYSTEELISGPVMFAQDIEGRHVAIKMLNNEEEYKVLRLLKDQPRLQDPDSFPSVMPILDLLRYENQWFAVMPRWGPNMIKALNFFPTFHLAIKYIISLLEGLAFLHELRIFHRDLCERNSLVNHFPCRSSFYHLHLKTIGALRYAIMDFDLAMHLDEKTYGANPRLPIELVTCIYMPTPPYETMHAYVDFDPFKYDVACLGIHFSEHYQQIIPDVPLLAPLIDRMITSNIEKRFTAAEALAFARTILPTVSPLDRFEREPQRVFRFNKIDRWAGLPESFIAEWGSYRENCFSWTMRFQDWVYRRREDTRFGWYLIYYARYTARLITRVPWNVAYSFPRDPQRSNDSRSDKA